MATFLQKVRLITLGNVHDLLDKAIDANSPSALRQYVRDLEDALDRMKVEAATQAGQVRTQCREAAELSNRIETTKSTIKVLVANNHEDLARPKAADILRMQQELTKRNEDIKDQKETAARLDAAVTKLEARHSEYVFKVHNLERLDRDTKAKEQAASALTAAGRLVGGGSDLNIDDMAGRMKARNDVASEKFDRAVGESQAPPDPDHEAKVDELLASLK